MITQNKLAGITIAMSLAGFISLPAFCEETSVNITASATNAPSAVEPVPAQNPVDPVKHEKLNQQTAEVVNQIPGVHVEPKALKAPAPEQPIKGFHPIKRALSPIIQLQKNSVQLQQQIMRLEGPIAGLQPAMLGMKKKMTTVEGRLENMQGQLGTVENQVGQVDSQITGVRTEITAVRKQIAQLQTPIEQIQKPLAGVATPLSEVKTQLAQVQALIASVLFTIMIASICIAVGTPIAAVLIYKNRKKIFPNINESEMPQVTVKPAATRGH